MGLSQYRDIAQWMVKGLLLHRQVRGLTTACTRLGYLARFRLLHAHCGQLCSEGSHAATTQRVKPTVGRHTTTGGIKEI